jgi:energy-coupling factor transporter ATP-binding protein EcfA2
VSNKISTSTVLEALQFSATLRLPAHISDSVRTAFVRKTMHLLELEDLAHTIIRASNEGGLSAEQLKRLTIAVECVANPSVLLLDEPTSALDARAAETVMKVVKKVVATGRTVICTIHQPSHSIFAQFDSLLLMKRGGRTTYMGPLGCNGLSLVRYLESLPHRPLKPPGAAPADWMLDVITDVTIDVSAEYLKSRVAAEARTFVEQASSVSSISHLEAAQCYPGTSVQFRLLFLRAARMMWRSPEYSLNRLVIFLAIATLFGSAYFDLQPTTQANLQGLMGCIFVTSVYVGVICYSLSMPLFFKQRVVYYHEQMARMYGPYPLFASVALVELPYLSVVSAIFTFPYVLLLSLPLRVPESIHVVVRSFCD